MKLRLVKVFNLVAVTPMDEWRLIIDRQADAFRNMGKDEALLTTGKPTLRLYTWKPSAVSIGYFQCLNDEVEIDRCKAKGVDIVRRITGGGAVFHAREVTYSLTLPESMVPRDILESYRLICGAVVEGLVLLGIQAEFRAINDIIANNKKISGSAQTRRGGVMLQHGTLLLAVDTPLMFSLLKVPDEKLRDKLIKAVEERVTSVEAVAGNIPLERIHLALRKGFEKQFKVKFKEGSLTQGEEDLTAMYEAKFKSREWNYRR